MQRPRIRRSATVSRGPAPLPGLNRRLTLELDRGRVRELLIVSGVAVALLIPLLAYVWQNVEWIEGGYAIEQLKNRRERLVEANHKLRLERASLQSLERVQGLAAEQLGLAEPPGGTVVLVSPPARDPRDPSDRDRLAKLETRDDDAAGRRTR